MQKNDNQHCRNTGSVANDHKGHSGRQVTVRTPANVQAVREHLQQSPRTSTRRLSQEVGISRAVVQTVIHTDLHLFPCKVPILQKQTDANKSERVEFCHMISERLENNQDVLDLIQFSDEADFHLSGHVNKQNKRFFGASQQPKGARCSSVVRAFAQGAMDRRIDPSWGGPIELFLFPASAPRLV